MDKLISKEELTEPENNILEQGAEESLRSRYSKEKPNETHEQVSSSSAKQEVEYKDGLHFIVYSEDNPRDLELVSAENIRKHYMAIPPQNEKQNATAGFTFAQLAAVLKDVKLPHPSWKIMVTLRDRKIMVITFTNSFDLVERSVSFNANSDGYNIIIDGRPVELLGSPGKVENTRDIEILLEIVETIDRKDMMIDYKSDF